MTAATPADRYRARIVRTFELLEAADGERKTLDELASIVGMSPFHLHRVFRALTGETIGAVAKRFRLARALRILRDTDRPITEVALEIGYDTPQNFARAFKAVTERTPSEVRADADLTARVMNQLGRPRLVAHTLSSADVEIVELAPIRTIGVRHVGPPAGMPGAYQRLTGWVVEQGLLPQVRGVFTVYENDAHEVPAEAFRAVACMAIDGEVQPGPDMEVVVLGNGPHAKVVHKGAYESLGQGYDVLYGRWLPASGRDPADRPPFEKYLNDPRVTPPDALRTEIYLPLIPEQCDPREH